MAHVTRMAHRNRWANRPRSWKALNSAEHACRS
jgi:hypothetical protein